MTVGERIKQRRLELQLTQEELAKRLGYTTRTAISNVEKGKEDITTTRCQKFADALDVTPAYLMGWDDTSDNKTPKDISDVEMEYIEKYRCIDKSVQKVVRLTIDSAYDDYLTEKRADSIS